MSINLVELGREIGEAQATADAALELAVADELAETIEEIVDDSGAGEHGCGEDCPCRSENQELRAALAELSKNYHEDMDLVLEIFDEVLQMETEESPAEEETTVEPVHVEEEKPEEEEKHGNESEASTDQSSGTGHASAGGSSDRSESQAHTSHEKHLRFARGRR